MNPFSEKLYLFGGVFLSESKGQCKGGGHEANATSPVFKSTAVIFVLWCGIDEWKENQILQTSICYDAFSFPCEIAPQ